MFSPGASIDDQRYGNGQALKVDRSVPMTVVIFIYFLALLMQINVLSKLFFYGLVHFPLPTQNIFSYTHHIKSFDACMEH
jgi:hypothetical protein